MFVWNTGALSASSCWMFSLARFVRASSLAASASEDAGHSAAFEILERVSMGDYSKWNIVYEPQHLRLHFRTWQHKTIKTVDLQKFDLGCKAPVKVLDMATPTGGESNARFVDYTFAANKALIDKGLGELGLPPALAVQLAKYPEMLRCTLQ